MANKYFINEENIGQAIFLILLLQVTHYTVGIIIIG
jgi:hypothetical protein